MMAEEYLSANKAKIDTFEAINAKLIKAENALQVQSRITNELAEIDRDLLQKKAELSQAVTDLKWKTYALEKSKKRTTASLFYGILGRRKEWQTNVQHNYELELSQHEKCKKKISLLESERNALDQQLIALESCHERYLAARQQQYTFIITSYSGIDVDQLLTITRRLKQLKADSRQMEAALLAGRNAKTQLQAFIVRLDKPASWGEEALMYTDVVWLLPISFITEQSVIAKLTGIAKNAQAALDIFQQELSHISRHFWPPLSVTKPTKRFATVEQLAGWWLYKVQQIQSRLEAKLSQLEQVVEELHQTTGRLKAEQNRLIDAIWKKENFA